METVGSRIKHVRKKKNLTQKNFAEILGITQANVSAIEKDISTPSLPLIKLICLKYDINESWIITGEGSMCDNRSTIDVRTNEGLNSKYDQTKSMLDKIISNTSEDFDSLKYSVESFSFFVSLLSPKYLTGENKTKYFANLYNMIDLLEKYIFKCSTIPMYKTSNNPNYEELLSIKNQENKLQYELVHIINEISNIYVKNSYPDYNVDL